jgi:hypothetical protein
VSDRPEIRIHRDPLRPGDYERREAEPGQRLIDWLSSEHPAGFGRPIVLHLNGRPLKIADSDYVLQRGDLVHVLVQPGAQVVGPIIVQAIISAAIAAVASIAFSLIFKPKRPNAQETPAPDPIYSITGAQVAARLSEPVPVLYGQVVTVPDYAAQPYVFFAENNQFLDQLLVIGQGDYDLQELLIGETPVSAMEGDAVQFWLFNPAEHGQAMGTIEAATGIMENVVTSAEVGDQELSGQAQGDVVEFEEHVWFNAPNQITFVNFGPPAGYTLVQVRGSERNDGDYTVASFNDSTDILTVAEGTIRDEEPGGGVLATLRYFKTVDQLGVGPFITNKPGVQGDRLILDFIWPGGLFEIDTDTGDLLRVTVGFNIDYQQVADDGTPIGAWVSAPQSVTANTNTPLRRTVEIAVAPGRYRVKVIRTTPGSFSANQTSNFTWAGLKFRIVPTPTPVYGPVCLLAIRMRATNGIASSASGRIRARVQRRLPPMGSGAAVPSRSPADAFCDVLANPVYGAGRPLGEIDLVELARLAASWGGQAEFNGAFAQRSTIWEALNIVLQTANAAPLPTGQVMSLVQDGPKASRRQLFTDANMVRGSLAVGYTFDRPGDYDGVRVEYRDPVTWNPLYSTWPADAEQPDQVQLFGCSSGTQAAQFAKLLWNKRTTLRKTAHFETELEGLLARMGDRIGISADLPRWGMSGVVVGLAGLTLWLDKAPDWSGTGHRVVLRDEFGQPSEPIGVTPGPEPNTVQLAALPPFALFPTGRQEATHYAFGDSVQLLRDFTVQRMEPRGALVGIEALAYDPAAYAGTLPWLETPT